MRISAKFKIPCSPATRVLPLALAILLLSAYGCTPEKERDVARRATNATLDRKLYDADKPRQLSSLTVSQAISIAYKYNLDVWMAQQQEAIRREVKNSSFLKMLPSLTFDGNYEQRDQYNASTSLGLDTGQNAQNASYSYSAQKDHTYGGIKMLWNVLDFGVSYYRSLEEANRQKQAQYDRIRTAQKLACDVSNAYWQCICYDRVAARANVLKVEFDQELERLNESAKKGGISESEALDRSYLLKTQNIKISEFLEKQQAARLGLLQLMGLPLDCQFTLADETPQVLSENPAYENVEELEQVAIMQRPELFQEDFAERISHEEAKATLISMFPSPSLFINPQWDSNKFLYYNNWCSAGVNVTWNMLTIPSKVFDVKTNKMQAEFTRKKRMALAAAIITQVRLAVIQLQFAKDRYTMMRDLNEDCQKITNNLTKSAQSGKTKPNAIVTQKARSLDDFARSQDAYAKVMIARATILQSIGADPLAVVQDSPAAISAPASGSAATTATAATVAPQASAQTLPAGDSGKSTPKLEAVGLR